MRATLTAINDAASRIAGMARRTPVLDIGDDQVLHVKCEQLQPIGAFKVRGACNFMLQLPASRLRAGVITYSSGNHGQAVAFAAQRLGTRAVVVMPETAPTVKVEGARRWGAEVIFAGTTTLHRQARAEAEAGARDLTIVPPFDCLRIIEGQGTAGLELLGQVPGVRTVYVPVGGGGLISGVAAALKLSDPDIRVVGVEPAGAAKMSRSLAAGQPITLEHVSSLADGLLAVRPGGLNFLHVQAFVDEVITVDEAEIVDSLRWLFDTARLVVEPSGAVAVAGARRQSHAGAAPDGPVAAILSGGNIGPDDYATLLAR